jgi:hypothetical protein
MDIEIWCRESYFLAPSAVSGSLNREAGARTLTRMLRMQAGQKA